MMHPSDGRAPVGDVVAAEPGHADHHLRTDLKLRRALGLPGLTLFGLVYLVPLTVFTTYGLVTEITGGRVALAYIVTLSAMIVTAFSYARMVRAYPVSGSAYTYTQKSFGGHVGFLAGWSLMLDYLLLPMVNYLLIGVYLNAFFPAVPGWVFVLAAIALVTVLNLIGITTIERANMVLIAVQIIFVVVFVALAVRVIAGGGGAIATPFTGDGSVPGFGPVLAGAAVLCLSFLGFDAVSTMVEEAREPLIDVPRAIVLVTTLGGLMFIVLAWAAQAAHPPTSFENVDAGALDVMTAVAGQWLVTFFTAAYVAGCIGSALTSQASVSRIMYVMGRDGVLPRQLSALAPRWRTPVVAILVVSVISLVGLWVDLLLLFSIVSFGALVAFSAVNLSVIKHYAIDQGRRSGLDLWRYLVMPLIGVALTLWLWTSLTSSAFMVGLGWLAVGVVWLAVVTRGFRRPPPEMDLAE
jgi:amino acid transporter